jgi:histidyl-tRNA synthetase
VARMVAAHERNYKKPVKWFSIPQLFRYERQQKGRLREHFQLNCDIFGEKDPAADAELIALLIDSLRALKLTSEDFVIRLSSRTAWQEFFQRETGNGEREADSEYRFFQVIDKLEREREEESAAKLAAIGLSVKAFIAEGKPTADLAAILGNLQARGLGDFVKIDYNVIRGLAYYTGPVFEAFARNSDLRAIAGGGRYDNLVKLISGGKVDLPALGFGMGDVVLLELLKEKKLLPEFKGAVEVVVLVEDESLRAESLGVVQQLREGGWSVDYALTPMKGDKQFKRAMELRATHTVRLEKAADGSVQARVKELATRAEKTVAPGELPRTLRTG